MTDLATAVIIAAFIVTFGPVIVICLLFATGYAAIALLDAYHRIREVLQR